MQTMTDCPQLPRVQSIEHYIAIKNYVLEYQVIIIALRQQTFLRLKEKTMTQYCIQSLITSVFLKFEALETPERKHHKMQAFCVCRTLKVCSFPLKYVLKTICLCRMCGLQPRQIKDRQISERILLLDRAEEKKHRDVFCILFWSPIPTCMCVCVCGVAGAGGVFPTTASNLSTQRWHQIPQVKSQSYRLLPHFRHQSQAQRVCF